MPQKITLEVTKKNLIAPDIYEVVFHLVSPTSLSFVAGQNMMLMIAPATAGRPGVNRTMSIASPPSSASDITMVHDVSPMGPGSQWTVGLKVGDKATIMAPTGGVLSLLPTERRKVLVATGTGIAPFRAIILSQLEKQSHTPIVLYWGLRYETDVYWKNEFDQMQQQHSDFSWHQVLSKPNDTWQGLKGHVTEHVIANEKELKNSEFYLCGSKHMVEEVRAKLVVLQVPTEQIKTELFF